MQVAGLHRACPSAALDKAYLFDKCLFYTVFWLMSIEIFKFFRQNFNFSATQKIDAVLKVFGMLKHPCSKDSFLFSAVFKLCAVLFSNVKFGLIVRCANNRC